MKYLLDYSVIKDKSIITDKFIIKDNIFKNQLWWYVYRSWFKMSVKSKIKIQLKMSPNWGNLHNKDE
jgi:hypothetical protein